MYAVRKETTHIIIHCSATPAKMDVDAKEIDRWHRAKGWLKIGYHFVIKRDGTIEAGRVVDEIGAHAKGYNYCSLGICMVGGMDAKNAKPENNFTASQWDSLDKLVKDMESKYPGAHIIGHCEVEPGKACPSFDVQEWLKLNGYFLTSSIVH